MAVIERNIKISLEIAYIKELAASQRVQLVLIGGKKYIIGRLKEKAHIIIKDEKLSRAHCQLFSEKNAVYICDLRTKNGTYVNGIKLGGEKHLLRKGDKISVGDHTMELVEIKKMSIEQTITSAIKLEQIEVQTSVGKIVPSYGDDID